MFPKANGSVRICGDYKGTVNPAIHTEQFPIPTMEDDPRPSMFLEEIYENRSSECVSAVGVRPGFSRTMHN